MPPRVSGRSASSSLALLGRAKDGNAVLALAWMVGVGEGVGEGVGVDAPLLLAQAARTTVSRPANADARKRFIGAISGACGGPAARAAAEAYRPTGRRASAGMGSASA